MERSGQREINPLECLDKLITEIYVKLDDRTQLDDEQIYPHNEQRHQTTG